MSVTAVLINLLALAFLGVAFARDRARAIQSLRLALKSMLGILPAVLTIIVIIGLLLAFATPGLISRFVGEQAGLAGIVTIAALGAVLYIPAIVAFPLAGSLLQSGAAVSAVAAFITTLTMVGVVTLPLEINQLGRKMALLRNGVSFVGAIVIALAMGVIL
jgi:uncharacterized membrane protein YraQ (UPF0718 family)